MVPECVYRTASKRQKDAVRLGCLMIMILNIYKKRDGEGPPLLGIFFDKLRSIMLRSWKSIGGQGLMSPEMRITRIFRRAGAGTPSVLGLTKSAKFFAWW